MCSLVVLRLTRISPRPLIAVLEGRVIEVKNLVNLQQKAVADIHLATGSLEGTTRLFTDYSVGRAFQLQFILRSLARFKVMESSQKLEDYFFNRLITIARFHALQDLKNNARIPIEKGWLLPGVADEGPVYEERGMKDVIKLPEGHVYGTLATSL
jgi:RNA-dependent RNA polymerase